MQYKNVLLATFTTLFFLQFTNAQIMNFKWPDIKPPIASKIAHQRDKHNDLVNDDYYWMIDYFKKGANSKKVVKHLEEENHYLNSMMDDTQPLQDSLYKEMRARIKEKDENVPYFYNGYYYYNRSEQGKQYYKICRKKGTLSAPEEVMLDVDTMAIGRDYYSIGGVAISPDNNFMVYGEDVVSRRQYEVFVKNLHTGKILPQGISNTSANYVWAADSKTIFYISNNSVTLLSEKVWRHELNTPVTNDAMVYQESNNNNYLSLSTTKADNYVLITSESFTNSEVQYLPSNKPKEQFKIFQPRMDSVLYEVDADNTQFYIRNNHQALNFKVSIAPFFATTEENWKDYVPHRQDVLVEHIELMKDFVVIQGKKEGLDRLEYISKIDNKSKLVSFEDAVYAAATTNNTDYNSSVLRYRYASPVTPNTIYDFDLHSGQQTLLKEQEIPSGYNKSNYITERVFVIAKDGAKIPLSIAYKKGYKKNGKQPFYLIGYGSYGFSYPTGFRSNLVSLMERGFAFGIAHTRGGQEMGRQWYEDGRLLKKINTFTDFIDCANYLIKEKYTTPQHLYANGGSAGGLLMGAVANMGNTLFNGIIADVPFVDVVNTMLDPTIPLTTNEYDQWGNPETNKEAYFYMKSYSPYENVQRQPYPNILTTTGLHDSQVQYFEPAKWVAKLREYKTNNNVVLLHTNMEYGHGGASGRFDYLKDEALRYAFLIKLEELSK